MELLLMHGAGLGTWIWDRVLPHLDATPETIERGHPRAVTLPSEIERVAARIGQRAILVGHSFSAEIAVGAAAAHPEKVAALVLVGGVVPESGQSFLSLLPPPQRLFMYFLLKRARHGITIPLSMVRKSYCNDLDEETTELVLSRMRPEAPRLYLDKLQWSSLREDLPRTYVALSNDAGMSLKQQKTFIERVRATDVETLATGHLPMLARPREMADVLNRVVKATR